METIAPPVVAVIVTCNPGEWFEETLRAFAAQDYPELSILVLDAASDVDPTPRVANVLPGAFVRRMPTNRGFGATANEALTMVQGASLLLFCHDDIAPDPDAVHIMVEESFRSNAGVVGPKLVSWDDPARLLHVGMAVDKGGAVVDRMEPGEIDHGQHDAVRDIFLAPGGCTLVRADLFTELDGFDPEIFAMGEDLDLCWRAQVLGARVVVAPGARVRHLEMLASGRRALPERLDSSKGAEAVSFLLDSWGKGVGAGDDAGRADGDGGSAESDDGASRSESAHDAATGAGVDGAAAAGDQGESAWHRRRSNRAVHSRHPRVTLQSLQRRHELHAALKAYGPFHLVRVIPQIALLALAEFVIARVAGHRERAAAVSQAWGWNLAHRRSLRARRAALKAHRRLDDATVRRLQLRGSARVNAYVRRAVTHGLQAANLGGTQRGHDFPSADADSDAAVAEALAALAESENAGEATGPARSTRLLVWLAAALVIVFGTRQLFGSGFPIVGQLLPLPSWATLLHRFVSGWQPTGVGTTDPTTPATGILGLAGMVLFGAVGLLDKIVVLGCIPVGAMGMARLTRPLGTAWARVTSTVIYLAIPVPYDALATGHWDALIMYAACPWIVHLLAQASRVDPFGAGDGGDGAGGSPWFQRSALPVASNGSLSAAHEAHEVGAADGAEATGAAVDASRPRDGATSTGHGARRGAIHASRHWRRSLVGWTLALGLLDAFVTALAPSAALVTLVVALGLALGNVVTQGSAGVRAAGRVAGCALGATVVAVVLLAPWSFTVLGGPERWQTLAGVPVTAASGAGWGQLLRLAVGPIGDAALAWAFLAAAALPLLIASRWRLAWAGRAWSMAVVAWFVAWAAGRGGLGPLAIAPQELLVPAGVGLALSVGLGVAAFQLDLPGYRFGWRQAAAVTAAAAAVVGMLPVLVGSLGGRWDLVPSGYGEATTWMTPTPSQGDFRVLWLGDPRVLPGEGWELSPGLAYTVSENGLPDATGLWPGSAPGAATALGHAVGLACDHATVRLGRLLAPYAVRYVVVVDTLGPSIPGLQSPISHPAPPDLVGALASQVDLRQIISQGGFDVFLDQSALPLRATRPVAAGKPAAPLAPAPAPAVTGQDRGLVGWRPALLAPAGVSSVMGRVPKGTVFDGVAPASSWKLTEADGTTTSASRSFGYAATFTVDRPGAVTVGFAGSWAHGVEVAIETAAWIVVAGALAGRAWWLDWWWRPISRSRDRRRRRSGGVVRGAAPEPEAAPHRVGPEPVPEVLT